MGEQCERKEDWYYEQRTGLFLLLEEVPGVGSCTECGWVRRINGETVSVGNNAVKLLVALAIGLRRAAQKLLEFNSSYPVGSLFEVCLCYGRMI